MNLVYTYGGVVENNKDPLKLGRLKVRVPHVYGSTGGGSGFVGTNDLPWALPAGLPAGASARSGGFSQLPEPGDTVWVRFLDGEPEKPVWEWGMQTYDASQTFKLQSYKVGTTGGVGSPDRTVWTRYNHAIEQNEGGVIATTSGGYRVLLNDSSTPASFDGSIKISTPQGNMMEIDDSLSTLTVNILEDVNFQIGVSLFGISYDFTWETTGEFSVNCGDKFAVTAALDIELTAAEKFTVDTFGDISMDTATNMSLVAAGTFALDVTGVLDITTPAAMTMGFSTLTLGLGTEPYVLGNQLLTFLLDFYSMYVAHTHQVPGVELASSTATAIVTTNIPAAPTNALLSQTILGR